MELDDHTFLNELLAMRREPWDISFPALMGDHFSAESGVCFDCFFQEPGQIYPADEGGFAPRPDAISAVYGSSVEPPGMSFGCHNPAAFCPTQPISFVSRFLPAFPLTEVRSSCSPVGDTLFSLTSASKDDSRPDLEPEELCLVQEDGPIVCKLEEPNHASYVEGNAALALTPTRLDVASSSSGKVRAKKVDGQPSKNLMAERRRRKRLNDRLSMLRSVVPKISKMDRTSILGDTIDYMRELLDRIQILREEMEQGNGACAPSRESPATELLGILKDRLSHDEALIRNTPKFNVERRGMETRVEMCCAARAGLLLSTVNTLEAMGMEIRQCVVSCFNDFGMHASCSEDAKQREVTSTEEIKQALFRNAGYGGRCL